MKSIVLDVGNELPKIKDLSVEAINWIEARRESAVPPFTSYTMEEIAGAVEALGDKAISAESCDVYLSVAKWDDEEMCLMHISNSDPNGMWVENPVFHKRVSSATVKQFVNAGDADGLIAYLKSRDVIGDWTPNNMDCHMADAIRADQEAKAQAMKYLSDDGYGVSQSMAAAFQKAGMV